MANGREAAMSVFKMIIRCEAVLVKTSMAAKWPSCPFLETTWPRSDRCVRVQNYFGYETTKFVFRVIFAAKSHMSVLNSFLNKENPKNKRGFG